MIQYGKHEHHDAQWLNRTIAEHLGKQKFTEDQEQAIKKLVTAIAAGYQRTLDRISWGPGWD